MNDHISQQFNTELEQVKNQVMVMGGLVEQQVLNASTALAQSNIEMAETVIENDYKVNSLDVSIDEQCTHIIALRQPTAGDLRLVMMIIKTVTDLERIGDEACKVARMAIALSELDNNKSENFEIKHIGDHVAKMLRSSLDAFARTDTEEAFKTAAEDRVVDKEYESVMRQLITHMMEDPRSIQRCMNILWAARALERIGDHSKNICEYVIYLVKGRDVRHISLEEMKQEVL